jgi:hypothetical protein
MKRSLVLAVIVVTAFVTSEAGTISGSVAKDVFDRLSNWLKEQGGYGAQTNP